MKYIELKDKYIKYYSDSSFFKKLGKFARKAGEKLVYSALLLFYLMKDPKTDVKTKIVITAALGYFIFPFDGIPDLTPIIGFSDDLSILGVTLWRVAKSITPEIKEQARKKMTEWFQNTELAVFEEVDSRLIQSPNP